MSKEKLTRDGPERNPAPPHEGAPGASLRRLTGKTAVVLGAGGRDNMGQAIARRFVAEGAKVVVAGRAGESVRELAAEIGALPVECDITDPLAIDRLFRNGDAPLDIAVNAVGRNQTIPFMDTTPEDINDLCRVHLAGPLLFTQAAIRAMSAGGSIIHITSVSAKMVMLDHLAYMATKAAGEVLVRAAAYEFGARGIRVNAIAPALTRTPMTDQFFADEKLIAGISRLNPLRRLGTVQDVADAAVWLAGDECFMTGEILQINGGMAMHGLPVR